MKKRISIILLGIVFLDILLLLVNTAPFPNVFDRGTYLSKMNSKLVWMAIFDCIFIGMYLLLRRNFDVIYDLVKCKNILWNLSKNDFKSRFVGSYLGVFWAFVNPIVTILLYWFVFQSFFGSGPVDGYPYVLWFSSGLITWFIFSEGLTNATNALLEYAYLVKKVVFQVDILPMVKIISASFVHFVFLVIILIISSCMGYYPSLYTLQVFYYFICMIVLLMALTYATSAIVLFFRDLGQFINVFMQVFMWMTPIMWNLSSQLPQWLAPFRWIFMLNPVYYIVQGYRDALIYRVSVFQHLAYTAYFWILIALLLRLGTSVFKRLRPHFADVL